MQITENVIELHFEDREGQVRVVPPDRDLMTMPVETAIEACRAFKNQIRFRDQFDLLYNRLGEWAYDHRDKISRAFLTTRDAGLLFLVVLRSKHHNEEFENELTTLDLDVANDSDFSLITLSVLALPNVNDSSIRSFLSSIVLRYQLNGD